MTVSCATLPLVTVAISVFNGGDLLTLSIRSVLNQSWTNWELILLDDGSTDGSIDRLECLCDPRITVVRDGFNRGLGARLNQAISLASGKYFARMDHDDICHPERFKYQVEYLEAHEEVDLLAVRCITIDDSDCIVGALPYAEEHAEICRRPWQGFYMAHPTWMGKTRWFKEHGYQAPAPYCCEDQELLLRAYETSCYHALENSLLAYRVRSFTPWKKQFRTHVAMGWMQWMHFCSQSQYGRALLSSLVMVLRVVYDVLKRVQLKVATKHASLEAVLSHEELVSWSSTIRHLKIEAENG